MSKQREVDRSHLVRKFAEAGVALEIAKAPIRQGIRATDADIFQLDIPRAFKGNTRRERFRIWPGHTDNVIAVQGIDRELQQLVLMVHEPKRTFTVTEYTPRLPENLKVGDLQNGMKVIAIKRTGRGGDVTVEGHTSDRKRHYLCGVDERQLFIAQLPRGVSNVRDAHAVLKRPEVTFAEGKAPGRTVRQGEWFFVNLTASEEQALAGALKKAPYLIHKNEPIERGPGHPHTAEEIVRMPGEPLKHGFAVRANEVYVRGKVKHEEHATVSFARWRKVIRNNEGGLGDGNPRPSGIFWID